MIEMTVRLETDAVETAVRAAWQDEFRAPSQYDRNAVGGMGYQEIVRQVRGYIQGLDMTTVIAAAAREHLAATVDSVVTTELRERAKKLARDMRNNGTLLQDVVSEASHD